MTEDEWGPDALLPGFQVVTRVLPDAPTSPGEPDDEPLTVTLVRPGPFRHRRALLYVHGWADYFFQTGLADFADANGFDLMAVELRRYGRNLRPGMLAGHIEDLDDYAEELDWAAAVAAAAHDRVTLMGHSTGGLVAALWASRNPGTIDALLLNSPWLDLHGSRMMKGLGRLVKQVGGARPTTVLTLPDTGFYARSINAELGGEWTFDLGLKQHPAFQVRTGWARAILRGHDQVRAGLGIDVPVLVLTSDRSDFSRTWHEGLMAADTVLDVDMLGRAAVRLGRHVTVVRIEGGLHDLALSARPAREAFFDEMARFLRAYT